jgi:serine protease AprX
MFAPRPALRTARVALAAAATLSLTLASMPGAAAAASATSSPTGTNDGFIDPPLLQQAAANPSGKVRVIITPSTVGAADQAVSESGGHVLKKLNLANATVAEVPAHELANLARRPGVARVSTDAPVKLQLIDPLVSWPQNLQTVYPLALGSANQWNANRQLRGTGVSVAVIDSGLQPSNPDFLGGPLSSISRVKSVVSTIAGGTGSGLDDFGHGTFVAGIVAGRGWGVPGVVPGGSYIGVAPDANLVSIKVSDSTGMAHVSDVIAGIEWAAMHRQDYNIRVLNLSLTSTLADSYVSDMLDAAVELAWFQGLVVIVAAGNAGPNAPITAPANDPFVITVGATDDKGTVSTADDTLASFSSYGNTLDGVTKPDLVAPGRNIVSTLASPASPLGTGFPTHVLGGGNYIRLSGTSASAPVVSGLVAQLLQTRSDLTPGQVKWLLTHTALPIAGPGTGAGYPELGAALNFTAQPYTSDFNSHLPNRFLLAALVAKMGLTASSVSWNSVSWNDVSWNDVSWNDVSWNDVSWNDVSWNDVWQSS